MFKFMKLNQIVEKLVEEKKIDEKDFKISVVVNNGEKKESKFNKYNYKVIGIFKIVNGKVEHENLAGEDLIITSMRKYENINSTYASIVVTNEMKEFNNVKFYDFKIFNLEQSHVDALKLKYLDNDFDVRLKIAKKELDTFHYDV